MDWRKYYSDDVIETAEEAYSRGFLKEFTPEGSEADGVVEIFGSAFQVHISPESASCICGRDRCLHSAMAYIHAENLEEAITALETTPDNELISLLSDIASMNPGFREGLRDFLGDRIAGKPPLDVIKDSLAVKKVSDEKLPEIRKDILKAIGNITYYGNITTKDVKAYQRTLLKGLERINVDKDTLREMTAELLGALCPALETLVPQKSVCISLLELWLKAADGPVWDAAEDILVEKYGKDDTRSVISRRKPDDNAEAPRLNRLKGRLRSNGKRPEEITIKAWALAEKGKHASAVKSLKTGMRNFVGTSYVEDFRSEIIAIYTKLGMDKELRDELIESMGGHFVKETAERIKALSPDDWLQVKSSLWDTFSMYDRLELCVWDGDKKAMMDIFLRNPDATTLREYARYLLPDEEQRLVDLADSIVRRYVKFQSSLFDSDAAGLLKELIHLMPSRKEELLDITRYALSVAWNKAFFREVLDAQ